MIGDGDYLASIPQPSLYYCRVFSAPMQPQMWNSNSDFLFIRKRKDGVQSPHENQSLAKPLLHLHWQNGLFRIEKTSQKEVITRKQ